MSRHQHEPDYDHGYAPYGGSAAPQSSDRFAPQDYQQGGLRERTTYPPQAGGGAGVKDEDDYNYDNNPVTRGSIAAQVRRPRGCCPTRLVQAHEVYAD